jgi:hypothetical protein
VVWVVVELLCAPPVLTTTSGPADVAAPVDVESEVNPVGVCLSVGEPVEVVADPESVDEPAVLEAAVASPVPDPLADEPVESVEAGSAHATP